MQHVARRGGAFARAVAGRQALDELRRARAAARPRPVRAAGRAVGVRGTVAVGRDRVDEGQRGDLAVEREGGDRRSAGRPAREVDGALDPERLEQRLRVVGPVAQAAGGVDRQRLGVAEAAHVGRDQAIAVRRALEQVLVEAARREVAVQQHDGDAVGGAGLEVVGAQAAGLDRVLGHRAITVAPARRSPRRAGRARPGGRAPAARRRPARRRGAPRRRPPRPR